MDPRRAENVLTWLLDQRLTSDDQVHEAPEVSFADLRRVHDDDWLARIDQPETVAAVCGGAPPNIQAMVEMWRRGVGGTIEAARWVRRHGGRASVLMGGFHHAAPDRGSGFCAINDVATAIAVLRAEGFDEPILVLDLDAHPPDGTAAFDLEGVEIRALSVESLWTAPGFIDHRVPEGTGDDGYLEALSPLLTDIDRFGMCFYLAGADPLAGDQFGGLQLSIAGLRERDHRVFEALDAIPTVILPAGGYTRLAWTAFAHTLAEACGASDTVEPSYDPIARRVGRIARSFAPFDDNDFEITEADLLGLSPEAGEHRFLDAYTRHGLEHAFERYGLIEMLQQAGFSDITVSIETTHWPHRLWVEGTSGGTRYRVAELALRFSHWEGYRLMFIDWLELKDPRRPAGRDALPGQTHPGLGIARDVIQILGVSARRLQLAGLEFVPSHYHVAWIARTFARHPDPQARGEFLAFREVLRDVPLGAASRVLHAPGLPTEDGEMLTWRPASMIHAIDEGLYERLTVDEERAQWVRRNTVFRLAELTPEMFED